MIKTATNINNVVTGLVIALLYILIALVHFYNIHLCTIDKLRLPYVSQIITFSNLRRNNLYLIIKSLSEGNENTFCRTIVINIDKSFIRSGQLQNRLIRNNYRLDLTHFHCGTYIHTRTKFQLSVRDSEVCL